jgi:hypothetical protein
MAIIHMQFLVKDCDQYCNVSFWHYSNKAAQLKGYLELLFIENSDYIQPYQQCHICCISGRVLRIGRRVYNYQILYQWKPSSCPMWLQNIHTQTRDIICTIQNHFYNLLFHERCGGAAENEPDAFRERCVLRLTQALPSNPYPIWVSRFLMMRVNQRVGLFAILAW